MANVFRTIEKESGPGGPQWMSDHPNPGNRYEYINREAQLLRVSSNARRDTGDFQEVQAHLRSMSPAPTAEEVARNRNAGRTTGSGGTPACAPTGRNVPRPDSRFTQATTKATCSASACRRTGVRWAARTT